MMLTCTLECQFVRIICNFEACVDTGVAKKGKNEENFNAIAIFTSVLQDKSL